MTLTDLRSEGAVVQGKAFLEGELLADVEIVFAHLDNSRSNQIFGPKNFVFTQQLLGVLDLAKAQERARSRPPAAPGQRAAARRSRPPRSDRGSPGPDGPREPRAAAARDAPAIEPARLDE